MGFIMVCLNHYQMKILVIDPISSTNHISYNNLLIKSLLLKDVEIEVFYGEKYKNHIIYSNINEFSFLPGSIYNENKNLISKFSLHNLYILLKRNLYIYSKIKRSSFDLYIFSSFEIFSTLPFYFIKKKLFFVSHNNYKDCNSRMKIFLYKKLFKDNCLIVLNNYVKKYFLEKKILNVIVHPHGLPNKFSSINNNVNEILEGFGLKKSSYIFLTGDYNLSELETLKKLSKKNNLKLFSKNKFDLTLDNLNNPIIFYSFLQREEYEVLLKNSLLVIINYLNKENYSTSNTFLECLSNNIYVKTNNKLLVKNFINICQNYFYYDDLDNLSLNINKKILEKNYYTLNFDSELLNAIC
jgi:hypothetical protein